MFPFVTFAAAVFCSGFVKATYHAEPDVDGWDPEWGVIDWDADEPSLTTTTSPVATHSSTPPAVAPARPSGHSDVLLALQMLVANPDLTRRSFVPEIRLERAGMGFREAARVYKSLLGLTRVPKWLHFLLLSEPFTSSEDLLPRVSIMFELAEGACPTDSLKLIETWRTYCIIPLTTGNRSACAPRFDVTNEPIFQLSRAQRQRLFADLLLAETTPVVSTTPSPSPIKTSGPMGRTDDTVEVSPVVGRAVKQPLESPAESPFKRLKASDPEPWLPMSPTATLTTTTAMPVEGCTLAVADLATMTFAARLGGLRLIRSNPTIDATEFWKCMRAQFPAEPVRGVAELLNSVYTRTRFALWFDARLRQEGYRLDHGTVAPIVAAVAAEANLTHVIPALTGMARDWIRFCKWSPCVPASEAGMVFAQARPESVRTVATEIMGGLRRNGGKSMRSDDLTAANRWMAFRGMSSMTVHSLSP